MAENDSEPADWFPEWGLLVHAPMDRVRMILSARSPQYGGPPIAYRHANGWTAFFCPIADGLDDVAASRLREHGFETILLDFHDEGYATWRWSGGAWIPDANESPHDLVHQRGLTVPGFDRRRRQTRKTREACLVETANIDAVRSIIEELSVSIMTAPRGVVVTGETVPGYELAESIDARVFYVTRYIDDGSVHCVVLRAEDVEGVFDLPRRAPSGRTREIDSIEGETTLPGILRALGIPLESMLSPDGEGPRP